MARPSRTGGKASATKERKASSAGRNPTTRPQKALKAERKSKKASPNKSSIADLQKQLERQAQELREARQQQAASSKVLHIIGASPGSLTAVFQAIVKNAV